MFKAGVEAPTIFFQVLAGNAGKYIVNKQKTELKQFMRNSGISQTNNALKYIEGN